MLDTQVVSYAFKGSSDYPVTGCAISSVVAQEFLQSLRPNADRLRYPLGVFVSDIHERVDFRTIAAYSRKWSRFAPVRPEFKVLNFGGDLPAAVEQGHRGVTSLVNSGMSPLFKALVAGLSKPEQKILVDRFDFLVENGISCVCLDVPTIDLGTGLMAKFAGRYQLKGRFRNSLNDVLILSAAVQTGSSLVTEDKLLATFAAEQLGSECSDEPPFVRVSIDGHGRDSGSAAESKGYINRNWKPRRLTSDEIARARPGRSWFNK